MRLPLAVARIAVTTVMSVLSLINPATGFAHGLAHHHDADVHAHVRAPSSTHADEHVPAVDARDEDAGHAALHFSAIAKRQQIASDGLLPSVPPAPVFVAAAIGRELTEPARTESPVPRPRPTPQGARAPPLG